MRIRIQDAGNITRANIESAGITLLGGPNTRGRSALLTIAYAAARASRLGLLHEGAGRFSAETNADHARAHAELNRCSPTPLIGDRGFVHVDVADGEAGRPESPSTWASTGSV